VKAWQYEKEKVKQEKEGFVQTSEL